MNWLDAEQFLLSLARNLTGLGVNWLIQSTLLLVFGLAAARMLRGHGSAVQSVVYRATLAAVLACPLVTAGLSLLGASGWSLAMPAAFTYANVDSAPPPSNEVREATQADAAMRSQSSATAFNPLVIEAPVAPAESPLPAPIAGMVDSSAAGLIAGGVAFGESSATRQAVSSGALVGETSPLAVRGFGLLAATFAAAWIAVASCLLLRLVVAWRELKKIRQQGVQADSGTMKLCRELSSRLRVCPPNVLHSPYVPGPCLSGLRQPAVMLPDSDLGLSLRDVLIHELAHLRRHDCHWNLLRRVGTALFWFQPLLWKLSALLEATAEEVCDDYVVQFGGDRPSYARRLVDIAELSSAPFPAASVGMVSLRSMLSRRVARILDTSRSLSTRAGGTVLTLVLVVGVLGTLAAGLVGLSDSAAAETTVETMADAARATDDASPAGSSDEPAGGSDENNTLESAQQDVAGTVPAPAGEPLNAAKDATGAESPPAANNESPDATKVSAAAEPIRGRVASADGKPVSGAKLYWGTWTLRGIQTPAGLAATTDAQGNFDFTPPDANPLNNDSPEQILNRMLVVVAPGHGMAVTNQIPVPARTPFAQIAEAFGAGGYSIQLPRDASIKGRIVNIDGEPVVDARVSVHRFDDGTQDGRSSYRAQQLTAEGDTEHVELKAKAFDLVSQFVTPQLADVAPSATTDADGRFELAGIGADRMVELLVQRDGVETKLVLARTAPGETIDIKADGNFLLEDRKLYGADFTLVAGPSKPIEGQVLDVDTGEPLVGAVVRTYAVHGERLSSSRDRRHFATVTDNEGRYRITGLPLGAGNKLVAFTVGDEPYVPIGAVADTSKGESPLTVDFRLKHGAWAEGSVFDAKTKAPLAGELSYFILRDPAIEKAMPGLRHAFVDELYFAGADGKFRVPVFPTRGVIAFRHTSTNGMTNYPRGAGAEAIEMTEDIGVPAIASMTHYIMADNFNSLAAVDPKEGERTVKIDIALSAGARLTVRPVDEQGKPLSGLEFYGRTEYFSWERGLGPVCEVQGLIPGEPRKIFFYDRRRNLAGAAVVDENTKDGIKVTLTPAARLRGRLVNEEGEPLTNVTLYPAFEEFRSGEKAGVWPDDPKLVYNPSNLPMDKDGRFEIVGLIPGWKYSGHVSGTKNVNGAMLRYGFGNAFEDVTLKPDEDRDLGDLVVKTE